MSRTSSSSSNSSLTTADLDPLYPGITASYTPGRGERFDHEIAATLLLAAVHAGNTALVKQLLDQGVNPVSSDLQDRGTLALACISDNPDMLHCVAQWTSLDDTQACDSFGWPPIHWLLRVGSPRALEVYSQLGWPLWVRDRHGNTCWHVVVKEEREDLVNLLHTLNRGEACLLIGIRNDFGYTPLELARDLPGREDVSTMLHHVIESLRGAGESDEAMAGRMAHALRARINRLEQGYQRPAMAKGQVSSNTTQHQFDAERSSVDQRSDQRSDQPSDQPSEAPSSRTGEP
eukprot:m.38590 g.38590  ORF g.38590 m.38590 type:complete len:290 (+) comp12600_c0_seq3:121-990(+)